MECSPALLSALASGLVRSHPPLRLSPQVAPEFFVNRDGIARREPLQQQRLQPRIRLSLLRLSQQAAEIFASVSVAFARDLHVNKLFEGFRERDSDDRHEKPLLGLM